MTLQVMVADDRENWRERITDALKNAGIECVQAKNKSEAIAQLSIDDLKVVCLNWGLENFSEGRELLKYIKENRSAIRVILISAKLAGETEESYKTSSNLKKQYLPIIDSCFGKSERTDWEQELVLKVRNILDNPKVRWGHISDLHIEPEDPDQQKVLEELISDISNFTPLDFMVISGDITYSGSEREFSIAKTFLDNLRAKTGLNKRQLFLVPGNHDVNWNAIEEIVNMGVRDYLISAGNLFQFFTSSKHKSNRQKIFKRLANYMKFTEEYFPDLPEKWLTFDRYFHNELLAKNGLGIISISSLNSAWSSAIHFDFKKRKALDNKKIMIGEHQVTESINFVVNEKSRMNILVVHHPDEWLNGFDSKRCWNRLAREYHIILHGHEHTPKAQSSAYGKAMTFGVGAATQDEETVGEEKYYNSHNRYYISEVDWGSGKATQFLRKFSVDAGQWINDIETSPEDGAEVPFVVRL
jgi:predicted MPP superfamily phosphohydrolase